MGWKKRAGEHVLAARSALDEADELISSDVATRAKTDIIAKHVSKGFIESALALAQTYVSCDATAKQAMRGWIGADVIDAAVALSISRSKKEAAA